MPSPDQYQASEPKQHCRRWFGHQRLNLSMVQHLVVKSNLIKPTIEETLLIGITMVVKTEG